MHHEAVLRYFKDRPDKLLVMDICGGDGSSDLCLFLNCPEPSQPFPHVDPLAARNPIGDDHTGPLRCVTCTGSARATRRRHASVLSGTEHALH